jgi:hypothetical protein
VIPDWVNWLAAISSIAGLGISCWVLYEARSIRNSFVLRGRLPDLLRALQASGRNLSTSLGNWPQVQNDALAELERIRSMFMTIEGKLSRIDRARCASVLRKMQPHRPWLGRRKVLRDLTSNEVWDLYTEILGVTEWLRQHEKDLRWK